MSKEMSMNGHGGPSLHANQRGKELHHPTTIGLQTARLPKWERVATGGAGERSFTDKQKAVFRKRRRDRFKIPDGSRWGDVKAASTNIGRAYEYLIKQFADDAGGKAGEFFTPPEVVDTLVYILEPRPGDTVYDPTSGSGGMLIHAADYLRDHSQHANSARYFAQEMNWGNAAIGKINSALHGLESDIKAGGSTITDPRSWPFIRPSMQSS